MKRLIPLALATFISDFGSALTTAALPVIFVLANRKDGIGIFNGVDAVGALIGAVWVMGFVDRFRKNWVAIFSDLIRALALLPLIFSDHPGVTGILVYSLAQALFGAATSSAIQGWIAEHGYSEVELRRANSLLEITSQVARAIAPLVGAAILIRLSPKVVFGVDAATYVIGAILITGLQSNIPARVKGKFLSEVKAGLQACISDRLLLRWISVSGVQYIGLALMNTVYLTLLTDRMHADNGRLTFFQVAYFLGALLGGAVGVFSRRSLKGGLLASSLGLSAVMLGAIWVTNYWVFFGLSVLQRAFTLTGALATRTLCQMQATPERSGRVMAFRSAAIDVFGIASYALALGLFHAVSTDVVLIVACIGFALSAVLSL